MSGFVIAVFFGQVLGASNQMSEKRKPDFVLTFRKAGKRVQRIELFFCWRWPESRFIHFNGRSFSGRRSGKRVRVRMRGKWIGPEFKFPNQRFSGPVMLGFTMTELQKVFFASVNQSIKRGNSNHSFQKG